MRFAKLEMALINAYFIGTFDFELSDKMGNSTTTPVPAVDRNAHTVRKSKEPIFLRYKPRKA
jgi:sterol 14-demethylase